MRIVKKVSIVLLSLMLITGCGKSESESNNGYLKIEEDVAFKVVKDAYTCENNEFFFVEKTMGKRIINFIYGSYSSPLSQKPYKIDLYSDGLYNLSFNGDGATLQMNKDDVLEDCKIIN